MTHTWETREDWTTVVDGTVWQASDAARARVERDVIAKWGPLLAAKATKYGVPWALMVGVCASESWGDPNAGSSAGAQGLMQVMPFHFPAGTTTAQMREPDRNVDLGAKILADAIKRVGRDVPKIAAVYNAGGVYPRASDEWGVVENVAADGTAYLTNVTRYTNHAATRTGGAVVTTPAQADEPASVIVLGDSISQGYAPALARLTGSRIAYRGRYSAGGVATEAVPGQTIEEIRSRVSGSIATLGKPRIVVVMAGTNDLAGKGPDGASVAAMSTRMGTLLDELHGQADAVIVVQVPPITRTDLAARAAWVDQYHAAVAYLVALRRAQGWPVGIVDPGLLASDVQTEPGLDGVVRAGGVHPTQGGYAKIAAAVWLKIQAYLAARSSSSGGGADGIGVLVALGAIGAFLFGGAHVSRWW